MWWPLVCASRVTSRHHLVWRVSVASRPSSEERYGVWEVKSHGQAGGLARRVEVKFPLGVMGWVLLYDSM